MPGLEPVEVFSAELLGKHSYRIPGLVALSDGSLLALADERFFSQADNPNRIRLVCRRSSDGGRTWEKKRIVADFSGHTNWGPAAMDACTLYDADRGRVWVFFTHSPAGVGLRNAEPGSGFCANGRLLLVDSEGDFYSLEADGSVLLRQSGSKKSFANSSRTAECDGWLRLGLSSSQDHPIDCDYQVMADGTVLFQGEDQGTIYDPVAYRPMSLSEYQTTYLMCCFSDDGGNTWSEARHLNPQVKADWMHFLGASPGQGRIGPGGEYLVPVYYTNSWGVQSSAAIISRDQGETWQMTASPNDFRQSGLSSQTLQDQQLGMGEWQLVFRPGGRLFGYFRNRAECGCLLMSWSDDLGESWTRPSFQPDLLNPGCQFSLAQTEKGLYLSGPYDPANRQCGSLLYSSDGFRWQLVEEIEPGPFMYSALAPLPDGRFGLLYENDADQISCCYRVLDGVE